jgi:hypothetical protein
MPEPRAGRNDRAPFVFAGARLRLLRANTNLGFPDHALHALALFPTADTNPPSSGGTCQELTKLSCFDSYQGQLSLGPSWQAYHFDFARLNQQGWGTPAIFDAKKLIGVNFQVGIDAGSFTLEVDDVTFL